MKKETSLAESFLEMIGVLAIIPLGMMTWGFCLSKTWGWFVAPYGLPSIGILQAYSLILVFGLLRGGRILQIKEDLKETDKALIWQRMIGSVITPFISLTIGYFLRKFL